MPLSGLPISLLVVLFLTVFVLIGINPALQKIAVKFRKLLHSAAQRKNPAATRLENLHAEIFADQHSSQGLNDFEFGDTQIVCPQQVTYRYPGETKEKLFYQSSFDSSRVFMTAKRSAS